MTATRTGSTEAQRLGLGPVLVAAADPWERARASWCRRVPTPAGRHADRLRRWVDAVGRGDRDVFDRVVRSRGLDASDLAAMLSDVALRDGELPDWGHAVVDLLARARGAARHGPVAPVTVHELRGRPVPVDADGRSRDPTWDDFAVHEPLLRAAEAWLRATTSDCPVEVTDRACRGLLVSLARRLARITTATLVAPVRLGTGTEVIGTLADVTVRDLCIDPGDPDPLHWVEVFRLYPVLARLVGVTWAQWTESTTELLAHLAADQEAIGRAFHDGRPLGPLDGVEGDLGDRHRGGRAVALLTFSSGCRVLHKPRELAIAVAFQQLVRDLDRRGPPLDLRGREVLARDHHTWEALVGWRDCGDEAAVGRYYWRYGMLARLLQVLHAHDLTCENLRADGEQPVPIDLETLFRPRPRSLVEQVPDDGGAHLAWQASIATTGLFTCRLAADPGVPAGSASPLSPGHADDPGRAPPGEPARGPAPRAGPGPRGWRQLAGDPAASHPTLDGAPVDPRPHYDEVLAGYRAMSEWLDDHAGWIAGPTGPLARMAGLPVRFLHRGTHVYDRLLTASLAPEQLVDGISRELELERLWRTLRADPRSGPLVAAEVAALRRLDVPLLRCRPDRTSVLLEDGREVPDCFAEPALDRARATVGDRADHDLVASLLHCLDPRPRRGATDRPSGPGDRDQPDPERWLAAAVGLARQLRRWAHTSGTGGIGWVGLQEFPWHDARDVAPLPLDLLNGQAGLTVVLAEVARQAGDPGLSGFATDLVDLLARRARHAVAAGSLRAESDGSPGVVAGAPGPTARLGGPFVGGLVGPGAVVHGLARAAAALGSPVVSTAGELAAGLDLAGAGRGGDDLVTGRAGLVLNLVAVDRYDDGRHGLLRRAEAVAAALDPDEFRPGPTVVAGWAGRELALGPNGSRLARASLAAHRPGPAPALPDPLADDAPGTAPPRGQLLVAIALAGLAHAPSRRLLDAVDAHLRPDPRSLPTTEVVGRLEVAVTAHERLHHARHRIRARALGDELLARRTMGSWFPDLRLADRHDLSAVHGLAGVALSLSRLASARRPRSLRLLD